MAREIAAGLLDWLFPPKCLACGATGEPFCAACRASIRPAGELPAPAGVERLRSAGLHEGPLRRAVLRLKFGRRTVLADALGDLLAAELEEARAEWQPNTLVPVPIHWLRRLERGYNQAELLARALAARCDLPVLPALRRTRHTAAQVGRSVSQRAQNVRGAFAADTRAPVAGRRVLLVDDVWTTGATLAECASTLRAAGAAAVCALTVTHQA